LSNFTCLPTPR